jgi:hypothetical protein
MKVADRVRLPNAPPNNQRKKLMIKPGKTFKLSKQSKRLMCSIVNPHDRNAFKRAMIQAELAAAVVIKREPKEARK